MRFATVCFSFTVCLGCTHALPPASTALSAATVSSGGGVMLVHKGGRGTVWLDAHAVLTDVTSLCVDAELDPWSFVTAFAVRGLDPRAIAVLASPNDHVAVTRDGGDDWIVRGSPARLRTWFEQHARAIALMHRRYMDFEDPRYFIGSGPSGWGHAVSRKEVAAQLGAKTVRVGWRFADAKRLEVASPAYMESGASVQHARGAVFGAWIDEHSAWRPWACPTADTVRPLFGAAS